MKKIFCLAVVGIFAGVILYGSGSVEAVKPQDITQGKIISIGYMDINASFLAPMPIQYVVQPLFINEPLSSIHMRHDDFFFHRMTYIEYTVQ